MLDSIVGGTRDHHQCWWSHAERFPIRDIRFSSATSSVISAQVVEVRSFLNWERASSLPQQLKILCDFIGLPTKPSSFLFSSRIRKSEPFSIGTTKSNILFNRASCLF